MDYPNKPLYFKNRPPVTQLNNISQFNQSFYVKAYKDVNPRFTNPKKHYDTVGIMEDRLQNEARFHELYPLFNKSIYIQHNTDLAHLTHEEIMSHFHHSGRFECRVYKKID